MECRLVSERMKALEAAWWRKRLTSEAGGEGGGQQLRASLVEEGLEPKRMGLRGEILFLLLGLKPAVLCTFPAAACGPDAPTKASLAISYATHVLLPSFCTSGRVLARPQSPSNEWNVNVVGKQLRIGLVDKRAVSSYCDDLACSLIVYNTEDHRAKLAPQLVSMSSAKCISEKKLAAMLDYPTYLKEGSELLDQQKRQPVIFEVGYWLVTNNEEPELLTSFGAESAEISRNVDPHFQQYASACAAIGFMLKLVIIPMS